MSYYSISYAIRCIIARCFLCLSIAAPDALGAEILLETEPKIGSELNFEFNFELNSQYGLHTQISPTFTVTNLNANRGWCCQKLQRVITQLDQLVATWEIDSLNGSLYAGKPQWRAGFGLGFNDDLNHVQKSIDGLNKRLNVMLFFKTPL